MISSSKALVVRSGLPKLADCLAIWKTDWKVRGRCYGNDGSCSAKSGSHGFTLIELMMIIVIIGALSSIAIPTYSYYTEKAKVAKAIVELRYVERDIIVFFNNNDRYPNDFAEIGQGGLLDPWGNPYQYLDVTKAIGLGQCRSNKFNNPINSDFDLFSMGRDGKFVRALTAQNSRDDIIRADNGRFVGPVSYL